MNSHSLLQFILDGSAVFQCDNQRQFHIRLELEKISRCLCQDFMLSGIKDFPWSLNEKETINEISRRSTIR